MYLRLLNVEDLPVDTAMSEEKRNMIIMEEQRGKNMEEVMAEDRLFGI